MLLDTQAVFVRATTLGFRADATGALSGNWTLNTGNLTPRDIEVKADGGINVCWEPLTAVNAPAAAYSVLQITDAKYFRLRGTLRISSSAGNQTQMNAFTTPAPFAAKLSVILVAGNVFGSGSAGVGIRVASTSKWLNFTVITNKWYRFIYERVNLSHYLYGSTTGATTPDGVPADSALTLLIHDQEGGFFPSLGALTLSPGVASSNVAISGSNYSGISDLILEEFTPLPTSTISTVSSGFPMPMPTPYTRYKSVRAAVAIYNNLVLGP